MLDDRLLEARHQENSRALAALLLHLCQRRITPRSALRRLERCFVGTDERR